MIAKKREEIAALNAKKRSIDDLEKAGNEAKERLAAIRDEFKRAKKDMESVFAVKSFSLQELGKGRTNKTDLRRAKKVRHEVLDKMSELGDGLSAQQRGDFEFFKTHWDDVNEQALGAAWPEKFAELTQKVQDEHCQGVSNAFSIFVHSESVRCLADIPRIRI